MAWAGDGQAQDGWAHNCEDFAVSKARRMARAGREAGLQAVHGGKGSLAWLSAPAGHRWRPPVRCPPPFGRPRPLQGAWAGRAPWLAGGDARGLFDRAAGSSRWSGGSERQAGQPARRLQESDLSVCAASRLANPIESPLCGPRRDTTRSSLAEPGVGNNLWRRPAIPEVDRNSVIAQGMHFGQLRRNPRPSYVAMAESCSWTPLSNSLVFCAPENSSQQLFALAPVMASSPTKPPPLGLRRTSVDAFLRTVGA